MDKFQDIVVKPDCSKYFPYMGWSLLDAYIMSSIQNRNDSICFLINSRYDEPDIQNNIKYNVSWKLDIDSFDELANKFSFCEADFQFELLKLKECNLKCRYIVVNISMQSKKDFHRNIFIH